MNKKLKVSSCAGFRMPLLVIPTRVNLVFSESCHPCHRQFPTASAGGAGDRIRCRWMDAACCYHPRDVTAARRGGQRARSTSNISYQ
jgi:hypothetical protein